MPRKRIHDGLTPAERNAASARAYRAKKAAMGISRLTVDLPEELISMLDGALAGHETRAQFVGQAIAAAIRERVSHVSESLDRSSDHRRHHHGRQH